jgi:hypothetical protein
MTTVKLARRKMPSHCGCRHWPAPSLETAHRARTATPVKTIQATFQRIREVDDPAIH